MNNAVKPLAKVVLVYPLITLAMCWIAVSHMDFPPNYTVPALMGTSASGLLLFGYFKRKMWLFVGGVAGVMFLSPTPLGVVPLLIGIAILLVFGYASVQAARHGHLEW